MELELEFANTVARGWAPRHPAIGPELSKLEVSRTRGDCISPLIQDGDTVYLDPAMPAQAGDLVAFALSERGAEVQNSALPPGQSPWSAGSRWIKLLGEEHATRFLLDRHGGVATVSLLGAEHPDAAVPLAVVRNIERNGRLLYTPTDSYSAQIGTNAATTVSTVTTTAVSLPTGGVTVAVLGVTMGPYSVGASVVCTASGYLAANNVSTTTEWQPFYYFSIIPSSNTLLSPAPEFNGTLIPVSSAASFLFTYEQSFFQSAGTTFTFYLNMQCYNIFNASLQNTNVASMVLKAEAILR